MDASISSGGWVRASGLPGFSGMLLPSELHRKMSEPAVGLEPTHAALQERYSTRRASPATCRVAGGSRTHNCLAHNQIPDPPGFGHSAPTWNRTRNTAFARPDDVPFTIEACRSVPRPGVEPGPAPSDGAMMSVSPSGHRVPGLGSNQHRRFQGPPSYR